MPGRAQLQALLVLHGSIAYWMGLHLAQTRCAKTLLYGMVAATVLVGAGAAIYQRVTDPTWLPMGREQWIYYLTRSSGFFGNPNNFAAWLALVLPLAAAAVGGGLSRNRWVRFTGMLVVFASLIGIGLSQSRGVILTPTGVFTVWLLVGPKWKWRWRIGGVLALLGGGDCRDGNGLPPRSEFSPAR